ncbi:SurA N-terminal domain-containing protein [Oceanospirillum sediminis]|uniref:Periplasmic chaperone PpiD n=1 Tax=Oceanospirillum sediminis TaxID=2760088 RepID=A0A839IL77_9GAMM|nr:SurA N-terminal domain-containing protein [Oceanospirillum sediminis]MBB1485965.1 SurA N-terminal domain-containing protein [Oceanospirillum sediminis]
MLQSIRDNSSSWIVKVIVGFIVITFALFGVDAIVGAFTNSGDEVATVNGEKISRYELEVAAQRQVRQVLSQMGPDADPSALNENLIRQSALQTLIDREAALQAAQNGKLAVSDLQIDRLILDTPEFRGADGQFSQDQFNAMLRNVGLQPLQFRQELKKDVLINQLQSGISLSGFTTQKYIDNVLRLDSQTRDIEYFTIEAAGADVAVSDDEVSNYYKANEAAFAVPEMVQLSYISLSLSELMSDVQVSEAELAGAYEAYRMKAEKQQAHYASHILLETEERSEEEALKLLSEAKARIDAGESFADLAKELSEDIGSSAQGGELGLVEQGTFDADFESALFALESGQVSDPVITEFGVHLIRLDKKEQAEVDSFDVKKAELTEALELREAQKVFVSLSEELANAAFAADDLASVADELKLKVQDSEFFSAQGGEGTILSSPKVIRAAFSDELKLDGQNSDLIEIDSENALVARVKEVREATVQPLADVSDDIRKRLVAEKQLANMSKQADTLLVDLLAGEPIDTVAETSGFEVVAVEGISRAEQSLPRELVQKAFTLKEGESAQAIGSDRVYLLSIKTVNQPEVNEEMMAFYRQAIELGHMRADLQQFRVAISEQAEVERL